MKVNGKTRDKEDVVYGPLTLQCGYDKKGEPEFWDFIAVPVWDRKEFDKLCPEPTPPVRGYRPDGTPTYDTDNEEYRAECTRHGLQWWGYLILKSLAPSNVEWDTVSLDDPETWDKVEDELDLHLAYYEFNKLTELVNEANALSKAKLEQHRKTFWQRRARLAPQNNSPDGAPQSTASGEPVSEPTSTQETGTN